MEKTKQVSVTCEGSNVIIAISSPVIIILPRALGALLVVFLRGICNKDRKPILSFDDISRFLGHPGRQWSHNIMKTWHDADNDLLLFLEDKRKISKELLALISEFVLLYPLRSILEQHREFVKTYPEHKMCINAFRDSVSAIDCSLLITSIRKQLTEGSLKPDSTHFISVLLNKEQTVSKEYKAYICDLFEASSTTTKLENKDINFEDAKTQKKLLISLLYQFGVAQAKLSLLFGISKTAIHNSIASFCDAGLKGFIIRMIGQWSGKICIDEKWIKIAGNWQYIMSAVDSVSGMPLFVKRFRNADTTNWILFLSEFKLYYGNPTLITTDGSVSLLPALKFVFSRVRHQLCWFHKLKNLYKRLYQIKDSEQKNRAFKLAKRMFHKNDVSGRKKSARELYQIVDETIQGYMDKSIFGCWLKLTLCLTNNAAERFNRKIEKCVACRYGIKNEACADVLIRGLWFSEILLNGSVHWKKDSGLENVNLPKIMKNSLDTTKIIHFLQQENVQTYQMAA